MKQNKIKKRFWDKVKKGDNCWEWLGAKARGNYGDFKVNKKNILAHRFSYQINKGKISKGLYILHTCDNPSCVNPEHLWQGTQLENMRDCHNKGRGARGKKIWNYKLKQVQVNEIRKKYNKGKITQRELAKQYNVDSSHISKIINKKRRKI